MDQVRPLLSYLVISYNHERFIEAALHSALCQSYSPLQIVLADDHSDDDTLLIATRVLSGYSGPHSLTVLPATTRVGIGRNISRAMSACHGELIVVAAGDDVSLPHRTARIVDAWNASGRQATSIYSSYMIVDESERPVGLGGTRPTAHANALGHEQRGSIESFVVTRRPVVNGCTHAWSPRLFAHFGPLTADLEDLVLSFRTHAIGSMVYIDEPLVRYRRHGANVSFLAESDDTDGFQHREQRLEWVNSQTVDALDNIAADLRELSDEHLPQASRRIVETHLASVRSQYLLELKMMRSRWPARVNYWLTAVAQGNLVAARYSMARLLPRGLYRLLFNARERFRAVRASHTLPARSPFESGSSLLQ